MLEKAKNITSFGVDIMPHDKRIIRAECSDLPFKNSSFDCVVCTAVIEHVIDQKRALLEFNRILRNKGVLIITTPNPLYSLLALICSHLGLKYKEGFDNSLSINRLKLIITECDFVVELSKGFLLLPFNSPFKFVERILARPVFGYTVLMNQLMVCKKR